MGKILNEKRYPCRIATTGVILELGCIAGPVPFCRLTDDQIQSLVMSGKEVYEKCPDNLEVEVRLLPANMHDHPFEPKDGPTREDVVTNLPEAENPPVVEEPKEEKQEDQPTLILHAESDAAPETEQKPDLSNMTKKERKAYYRSLSKQAQESVEQDPTTPDA